jgi:four helix bundle protein
MAGIRRFEEIEAWQLARRLTQAVYGYSKRGSFARDFGLKDQIRRASVSVMSNIAEGFEREGAAEFSQFLAIAKGSAAEVRSQLYVALDQGHLTKTEFEELFAMAESTRRLIAGFQKYLKSPKMRGQRFS